MRKLTPTAALLAGLLMLWPGSPDADVLWDQSDFRTDSSANTSQFLPVNDFTLAQSATITGFSVWLSDAGDLQGGDEVADGVFRSFSGGLSWFFFQDAAGLPGALIDSGFDAAPSVTDTGVDRTGTLIDDIFRVDGVVSPGLQLGAGTYWFGVREGMVGADHDDTDILWLTATGVSGEFAKLFLDGANIANLNEAPTLDNAFRLEGVLVPAPTSLVLLLAGGAIACRMARARGRKTPSR